MYLKERIVCLKNTQKFRLVLKIFWPRIIESIYDIHCLKSPHHDLLCPERQDGKLFLSLGRFSDATESGKI